MADTKLMPLAGINNAAEDAALQRGGDAPRIYVRDAINVDLTPAGKAYIRPGLRLATRAPYRNLWQSPLHRDVFGTAEGYWVRVDPFNWTSENLVEIGDAKNDVSHQVLNNAVCVATPSGIFTYDGRTAQRLTLDTPAAPLVMIGAGSMPAGAYGVAVAWLRESMESALSAMASAAVPENGAVDITLPLCMDDTVTGARVYLTRPDGGELLLLGDFPLGASFGVPSLPELGRPAQFRYLAPMPTGRYLSYWRGRLLTAKANVLRFSEAMAYHLHDERHGFVQMPQRITFVRPVDGGIWVGQVDHVAFLDGATLESLAMVRKNVRGPVPGSAVLVDSDALGGDLSEGGANCVVWLADNGYVVGMASGQAVELQAGVIKGIAGSSGTSVVLDRRMLTTVI